MAALTITAANVKWLDGVRPKIVDMGATVARGQVLFKDGSDNKHKLANADDAAVTANAAAATVAGLALTDGTDGSQGLMAINGAKVNVGTTTVAGVPYCLGNVAGAIVPYADLVSGDTPVLLFWGTGTAEVTLAIAMSVAAIA